MTALFFVGFWTAGVLLICAFATSRPLTRGFVWLMRGAFVAFVVFGVALAVRVLS